jgi:hypothetical protein
VAAVTGLLTVEYAVVWHCVQLMRLALCTPVSAIGVGYRACDPEFQTTVEGILRRSIPEACSARCCTHPAVAHVVGSHEPHLALRTGLQAMQSTAVPAGERNRVSWWPGHVA